jgi:nitroreductase
MEALLTRRSIRHYMDRPVERDKIRKALEAAHRAPSGKNNQPWRFVIIQDRALREELARLTVSGRIIREAPVAVAVFMDTEVSYHREKDIQSMGACIENMLLAFHCQGLGAVWLGEILKNRKKVESMLEVPPSWEFMALVSAGHPARTGSSDRVSLEKVTQWR